MRFTSSSADLFLLGIALLIGLIRFHGLADESLWLDEAKGASFAFSPISEWWEDIPPHQAPPGHFLLLKAMGKLGREELFLRLPSAVAGWMCILLVWSIARELRFPLPALPSLLVAVSPLFFHFSQEARCYTLWTLSELAVWTSLLRWNRNPCNLTTAVLCGFLMPLPLLVHYHALWFLVGRIPLTFFLLSRCGWNIRVHFIFAFLCSSVLSVPWLAHQAFSMPPPNPNAITEFSEMNFGFWTRSVADFFGLDYPVRLVGWLLLGGSIGGGVLFIRSNANNAFAKLFLASLLIPPVLAVGATLLSERYLAVRHLLPLLPPLLIFLSYCFLPVPKTAPPALKWASMLAGLLLALYGTAGMVETFRTVDRPPWREVAEFLVEEKSMVGRTFLVGDNISVLGFYRDDFGMDLGELEMGIPTEKQIERVRAGGILLAGQEDGASRLREIVSGLGWKPVRVWTSLRISPIEYFRAEPEQLRLLLQRVEEKVGSHP